MKVASEALSCHAGTRPLAGIAARRCSVHHAAMRKADKPARVLRPLFVPNKSNQRRVWPRTPNRPSARSPQDDKRRSCERQVYRVAGPRHHSRPSRRPCGFIANASGRRSDRARRRHARIIRQRRAAVDVVRRPPSTTRSFRSSRCRRGPFVTGFTGATVRLNVPAIHEYETLGLRGDVPPVELVELWK
jgi:hypothetical protein